MIVETVMIFYLKIFTRSKKGIGVMRWKLLHVLLFLNVWGIRQLQEAASYGNEPGLDAYYQTAAILVGIPE